MAVMFSPYTVFNGILQLKVFPNMDSSKRNKISGLLCCVFFIIVLAISNRAVSNTFNYTFQEKLKINYTFQEKLKNLANSDELTLVLADASMPNKTVIITSVNAAWMESDGIFDLFVKSFHVGEGTQGLLNNLLVVAHDEKAYNTCISIHPHCYRLKSPGVDFSGDSIFMSQHYLKMTHSKILFLKNVVQRGYTLVYSDSDILWLRNPFQIFSRDADFEMSRDSYYGNPQDVRNTVNTGFMLIRSNNKTVEMLEVRHNSTITRPRMHDQDVWNVIKLSKNISRIGLNARFLDTKYFSGFCQSGIDFKVACTMHANCCRGLKAKAHDLREALQDWTQSRVRSTGTEVHWRGRQECKRSWPWK